MLKHITTVWDSLIWSLVWAVLEKNRKVTKESFMGNGDSEGWKA